jgi:biotin carboxyl carrier protein
MASKMLHYVVEFDDGTRFSVHIDPDDPSNLKIDDSSATLDVSASKDGLVVTSETHRRVPLRLRYENGELIVETADGVRRRARVALAEANDWRKTVSQMPPPPAPEHSGRIMAPIAGSVVSLLAANGSRIKLGAPMLILEAMKMQNTLMAPLEGVINYKVTAGQTVRAGDLLATIGEKEIEA